MLFLLLLKLTLNTSYKINLLAKSVFYNSLNKKTSDRYKVKVVVLKVVILNVVMNIANFFDKGSKKKDLSGDSNPEEKRKKVKVTQTTAMFSKKDWGHHNVRKYNLIVSSICRKR